MTATTPPPLAADLTAGLRRLKLATIREVAPELLLTAKTQRWAPEEILRALVEREIAARDASNQRARLKEGQRGAHRLHPLVITRDMDHWLALGQLAPQQPGVKTFGCAAQQELHLIRHQCNTLTLRF